MEYYAKEIVSKKLNILYYSRELFYNDREDLEKISFKKVFQRTEEYIDKEVDLDYAIRYKAMVAKLVEKILKFSQTTKVLLGLINANNSNMRNIHSNLRRLYSQKLNIEKTFFYIERSTRYADFLHIFPYYAFVHVCEGMYLSSTEIGRQHRLKISEKKQIFKENSGLQNDANLLQHALVLSVGSSASKLGQIEDVYGTI